MDEMGFGQWLSRQRKSIGLTQKQLAVCVNCATITVRKLEAEQRRPSLQVIERLAQVFNVPHEQQPAFFRFARGDNRAMASDKQGFSPWQSAIATFPHSLLDSIIAHIKHEHDFSTLNGLYLDDTLHLVNQVRLPEADMPIQDMDLSHGAPSSQTNSIFLLMLVPIELPVQLAHQFIGSPYVDYAKEVTGE